MLSGFVVEILQEILKDRIGFYITDDNDKERELSKLISKSEMLLQKSNTISIQIVLEECEFVQLIESWCFELGCSQIFSVTEKAMHPSFLKQAVRSHLYFSPLRSLAEISNLKSRNSSMPKLSIGVAMFRHKTYLYEDEYDSHHFPVCGGEMCKLGVNFQWLKREPLSKILHLKTSPSAVKQSVQSDQMTAKINIKNTKCQLKRKTTSSSPSPTAELEIGDDGFIDGIINDCQANNKSVENFAQKEGQYENQSRSYSVGFDPRTRLPLNSSMCLLVHEKNRRAITYVTTL